MLTSRNLKNVKYVLWMVVFSQSNVCMMREFLPVNSENRPDNLLDLMESKQVMKDGRKTPHLG